MNYERDAILDIVVPKLNSISREYGENIDVCDLRWGVNTSALETEDGSKKVLSVCLDEIDNCRPYMIVLLGERYGWIPSEMVISTAIENRVNFALDELEKSVTALEIEYGALSNQKQLNNTLFYFRELSGNVPDEYKKEDEYHKNKLEELKKRITSLSGGRVKSYSVHWNENSKELEGMNDFSEMVISDVISLMEGEWRKLSVLTKHERDLKCQWEYAYIKERQFSSRDDLIKEYLSCLEKENTLAIKGPSGSGKSTLLSHLAIQLSKTDCNVLPIFCGSSLLCSSALDVIKYIIEFIETKLNLSKFTIQKHKENKFSNKVNEIQEYRDRLAEVVANYTRVAESPLFIIVDGIDQLIADDNRDKLFFIPENLSDRVKLVFSCLDTFSIFHPITVKNLTPLENKSCKSIIDSILKSMHRDLDDSVIFAMINKKGSNNPLYLSLLIQRLIMMDKDDYAEINACGGDMNAITEHQVRIIETSNSNLEDICVDVLTDATNHIGGDNMMFVLKLLATSRHGLRERDLSEIFHRSHVQWNSLDFIRFIHFMSNFIFQRADGRYDFTHKCFRLGIEKLCDQSVFHKLLLKHFYDLTENDHIRSEEFVFHCILAEEKMHYVAYVKQYINNQNIIEYAAKDTIELARRDNGAWLIDIINNGEKYNATYEFVAFVNYDIDGISLPDQKFLEIRYAIHKANCMLVECLLGKNRSNRLIKILSDSYTKVGKLHLELCSEDCWNKRLEAHQKSLSLHEELLESNYTIDNIRDYIEEGLNVCEVYTDFIPEDIDGCENIYLSKAYNLCQQTFTMLEKLSKETDYIYRSDYARILVRLGDILYKVDRKYAETRLFLYKQGFETVKQLAIEYGKQQCEYDLAFFYSIMGSYYKDVMNEDSLKMALEYYLSAYELQKHIAQRDGTVNSLINLTWSCKDIADIYQQLGENKNLFKVLLLYEEALSIIEPLIDTLNTGRIKAQLSGIYNSVGDITVNYSIFNAFSNTLEEKRDLEKILNLLNRRLVHNENQASQVDKSHLKYYSDYLFGQYFIIGHVNVLLGGIERCRIAIISYEKCISIKKAQIETLEEFYKENNIDENNIVVYMNNIAYCEAINDIIKCAEKIGDIYNSLTGDSNKKNSLKMYIDCRKKYEKHNDEDFTEATYNSFIDVLKKIYRHSHTDNNQKATIRKRIVQIYVILNESYSGYFKKLFKERANLLFFSLKHWLTK